jgi:hypothetical protein
LSNSAVEFNLEGGFKSPISLVIGQMESLSKVIISILSLNLKFFIIKFLDISNCSEVFTSGREFNSSEGVYGSTALPFPLSLLFKKSVEEPSFLSSERFVLEEPSPLSSDGLKEWIKT